MPGCWPGPRRWSRCSPSAGGSWNRRPRSSAWCGDRADPDRGHADDRAAGGAYLRFHVKLGQEAAATTQPIAQAAQAAVRVPGRPGRRPAAPQPTRVLTVANQKGGVGKTTTHRQPRRRAGPARAAGPGDRPRPAGQRVDRAGRPASPPAHRASTTSWWTALPLAEVVQPVDGIPGLFAVPATIDLAGAEIELVSLVARESRLQRALDAVPLSGSAPGRSTTSSSTARPRWGCSRSTPWSAADEVLIPIQCEYYALEGLGQLLRNVDLVRAHLNPALHVSHDPADDVRRADPARRAGGGRGAGALRRPGAAHGHPAVGAGVARRRATARP